MEKFKLVCFDVDGTLVDGVSWFLLTEGLGCSPQEHLDIFERAKKGEISFSKGERLLTKMYQDSGNASQSYVRNLFSKAKVKPAAKNLMNYLRKKGYIIYLISGAIDTYVENIAKKLKVDGFYANSTLDFDNKGILKKINYRNNQGSVKLEQLEELIQKLNLRMDEVVFVGDSWNDIEVFEKTRHGIAVHCFNEKLKKVAWKKIDSLEEIRKIL